MPWPIRILTLLAAISFLAACDDDPAQPGGGSGTSRPPLSGHVTMLYDTVAVSGVQVALVSGLPYRLVDAPVETDAEGYFAFDDPPLGDWYLFVFTEDLLMFNGADARVSVRRGDRVTRDIEMIQSDLWDAPRRITGRVTDAQTGAPVEGAFVSSIIWTMPYSFTGITLPMEGVTDADGRYAVAPTSMIVDPAGPIFIHPLGVSGEGYAPFYMMDVPVDDSPDSVYVLDVALEPARPGGVIRGRIVDTTGPVANLPIALDFVGIPLDTLTGAASIVAGDSDPNVPLPGGARTDAAGRFEFSDLVPGTYFLEPGYLPDDGYVNAYDEAGVVEITGGETIDAGDVPVWPALVPLSPPNGAVVFMPRPTVSWQAIPGADRYQLAAGAGHFLDYERDIVGGTSYQFDFDLPPGAHVRWTVRAFRTATPFDEEVSTFEAVQTFSTGE